MIWNILYIISNFKTLLEIPDPCVAREGTENLAEP